jgi:hypothetical protein
MRPGTPGFTLVVAAFIRVLRSNKFEMQMLLQHCALAKRARRKAELSPACSMNCLLASHDAGAIAQGKKDIDDLVDRYESVEAEIRRTSPRYAALSEPHTLSLPELQSNLLDSETAIAEFWLAEERSYGRLVTKTDCRGFEFPARAAAGW